MTKRTRPGGVAGKPKGIAEIKSGRHEVKPLPALNTPYPGCCKTFPVATFERQRLVKLDAQHTGPLCKGYLEPMSLEDFRAEVDARTRSADGGDAR